jgi:hypothetical protein
MDVDVILAPLMGHCLTSVWTVGYESLGTGKKYIRIQHFVPSGNGLPSYGVKALGFWSSQQGPSTPFLASWLNILIHQSTGEEDPSCDQYETYIQSKHLLGRCPYWHTLRSKSWQI